MRYNVVDKTFVAGIPDLVVLLSDAKVLWIEVKSKTGKRSPSQEIIAQMLVERGQNYILARSVDDVVQWFTDCGLI